MPGSPDSRNLGQNESEGGNKVGSDNAYQVEKAKMSIIAQDLDYKTMVEKARAIELTKKEMDSLKGEDFNINYLNNNNRGQSRGKREGYRGGRGGRKPAYSAPSKDTPGICKACGFPKSEKHECRAKNECCLYCQEVGHYARMCPKKKPKQVRSHVRRKITS